MTFDPGLKERAEKTYKETPDVHCPYLGHTVALNRQGWEHLLFKRRNHARSLEDQQMRLRLLKYVPELLSKSHTVQGIGTKKEFVEVRRNNRNDRLLKEVTYYEFVAVIDKYRVKVLVRKIEGGFPHFWSVIPHWKPGTERGERVLLQGNPEED